MARRRALVKRLTAVETLGSTDVICTDKTGTLTEGTMKAQFVWADGEEVEVGGSADPLTGVEPFSAVLRTAVRCNNARVSREGGGWERGGRPERERAPARRRRARRGRRRGPGRARYASPARVPFRPPPEADDDGRLRAGRAAVVPRQGRPAGAPRALPHDAHPRRRPAPRRTRQGEGPCRLRGLRGSRHAGARLRRAPDRTAASRRGARRRGVGAHLRRPGRPRGPAAARGCARGRALPRRGDQDHRRDRRSRPHRRGDRPRGRDRRRRAAGSSPAPRWTR